MGRDLRPKHKLIRKFGENILDTQKNPLVKRNFPPGQHGPKGKGRVSEYGKQLAEKQKAKAAYGVLERQFENYYKKATAQAGNSAENFLHLLEIRLDNIVYRIGFAQTRRQARQLVSHKHIKVNGKKLNIPSYTAKPGDTISLSEKAKLGFEARKTAVKKDVPEWMSLDEKTLEAKIISIPNIKVENQSLQFQSIIEFYSR
ncbi:MAG: 30S ribosomal protein S4 [Candidatus Kerfeldbacteria bacterium CG08_land_8_20_14_0_20_42_7]|uniref:Small ribosomal subunit protein uS4 n=1 Tax=Candidatus Kerfeldbacteria bacterium CG08_land_8_20_14_0_20_42_7 TaxID=2014245 RepID=A0A2H0YSQ7_9BACT|nr:MAG: 30S ribosomal protein S4 [Candidatus Kerfeldbacteria bacterium CG08_land_8_20_14_0_20_42_7]